MDCIYLTHKESSANSRKQLVDSRILSDSGGNRILSTLNEFDSVVADMDRSAKINYNVDGPLYTRERRGNEWFAVGNNSAFESIDNARKDIGIYDTKESIGSFNSRIMQDTYAQEEGTEGSKASTETISKVKEFLKRIGVDIQTLDKRRFSGVNAVAELLHSVIQISEGKEDVAITEEAMHFAVAILKQDNPKLYSSMMNRIRQYDIYETTKELYQGNKAYQKDGLTDVVKLKEEAIGKLLAEYYIKSEEGTTEKPELMKQTQSWWESLLNWVRSLIGKAGFNPFEKAIQSIGSTSDISVINNPQLERIAARIMTKNIPGIFKSAAKSAYDRGDYRSVVSLFAQQLQDPQTYNTTTRDYLDGDYELAEDIMEANSTFLQVSNSLFDKVRDKSLSVIKEGTNYNIEGRSVANSISNLVENYYQGIFKDKDITKTDYQRAIDEIKSKTTSAGQQDIDNILKELIDENGRLINEPFESSYVPQTNSVVYDIMYESLKQKLSAYPNAQFLSQVNLVDEKRSKPIGTTIDLMAINSDGTISIVDWEFLDINTDKYTDIPSYKKKAYDIQMAQNKRIIADIFSVPNYQIKAEVIPVKVNYKYKKPKVDDGSPPKPVLQSVQIGKTDVNAENRDYLLPVTLSTQSTGNRELDKLIGKLNALKSNIDLDDAITTSDKLRKTEQLQAIEKAVKYLSVKHNIEPLIKQSEVYTEDVNKLVEDYNSDFKDITSLSNKAISDFGKKLDRALEQVNIYTNLDVELNSLDIPEESKKKLNDVVSKARFLEKSLINTINSFGEKLANSEGYTNITAAEVQVAVNKRLFNETSKLPLTTLKVFYEKRREAQNLADITTNDENTELQRISEEYEQMAKRKGYNIKNMFSPVINYDKWQLISEFKSEFYASSKKAAKDRDIKWIKENIDIASYKSKLAERLKSDIELIDSRPWSQEDKDLAIANKKRQYDTSKDNSAGWFIHPYDLYKYPIKDKWTSDEWRNLNDPSNKPAKDLYDWIIKINNKAKDAGYLPDVEIDKQTGNRRRVSARTFLPYIVKSFAEKLAFGGKLTLPESFIRSMTVDEDTVGLGSIDKLTGKPINKIPKYFTRETEKEVSTNLIKNVALYNQYLNHYKFVSDTEGIAKVLSRVERNKQSIITSQYGRAIFNKETGEHELSNDNTVNANLFDEQIATLVYGQKYVSTEAFDKLLGRVGGVFDKVNEKIGFKLLPEGLADKQFSLNKSIDTLNRYFQQKTLGLNPLPALSNLVGGKLQIFINSGKWMSKSDIFKANMNLMNAAVKGQEGKKLIAALKYFMPYTGNEVNQDLLKKLSVTQLTEHNIQEFLMVLMRNSDKYIQSTIFASLWENAVLIDGKIHNARDYIRTQTEYKDRYSTGNVQEQESKFNELVKDLLSKHSLAAASTVSDKGELIIPGVDRLSKEVFGLRNLSKALSKRATGNLSPEEVRGVSQNVWSASFMVFKNWIPSLLDVRFGAAKYSSDVEAYEWGRARTVARIMANQGISSLSTLVDLITFNTFSLSDAGKIVKGTPKGLERLQELYEYKKRQYYQQTGQVLDISAEEFYDLVRQNIRSQAKDTMITLSLLSMFFALKAVPDDDEDEDVKNYHKFMVRTLDKLSDEVSFYYSPNAFQQILNGTIMPSVGIFSDGASIISHGVKELYGIGFDEKIEDKNYFLKYVFKSFPIANQMSSYLPLYAPDIAESLGIKISSESRSR